jgi:hypothetical protein
MGGEPSAARQPVASYTVSERCGASLGSRVLRRLFAPGVNQIERGTRAMTTEEITLRVSQEAARAFERATPAERLRLEALVSLQLLGRLPLRNSLDESIERLSQEAQRRGLTPDVLEELLREAD